MIATVTRWPNLKATTRGEAIQIEWDDLFERFSRVVQFNGDMDHPGWSAARFEPCERALENVREVGAIVLDYDKGETIESACELWKEFYGFLHSTRKHTAEAHRFRVVLPLARPVSWFEYQHIWDRVNHHAGGKLDPAPKDPSRFWFTPGIKAGGEFRAVKFDGKVFNPDEWLRKPAPVPIAPVIPIRKEQRQTKRQASDEERARAYLATMDAAYSGQGGHTATWSAALLLAQGFGLNEQDTFRILWQDYNPRCVPPWSEKELRHKAHDAARKARVPNGYKLGERYDWIQDEFNEPDSGQYESVPEPDEREPGDDTEEVREEQSKPQTATERHGIVSMAQLLGMVYDELQKPENAFGVPTGNMELDYAIGGFRSGNVTVLGAKRSFGKTSMSIMTANVAIGAGHSVLLFAGEDSAMMYGKRIMAMRGNINALHLRDLECDKWEIARAASAWAAAPKDPFFVRTEGRPVEWVAHVIQEVGAERKLDLVIVDYLQCVRAGKKQQDRRNEVTYVTKTLVDAIRGVKASGLLLSQLKRSERTEPEIEDLKESGDIEDMADHILLGWKIEEDGKPPERKIRIAKNKDGVDHADDIDMPFDLATASFKASSRQRHSGTHADSAAREMGGEDIDTDWRNRD
jgi:DnaB helicase-like protein